MAATRVVRILMLLCLGLSQVTLGDYGSAVSLPKLIIKSAGPSQQHRWLGHGGYVPSYVPRPRVIPKWNVMDPTYTAFWIANTPAPTKGSGNNQASKHAGFGPPKQNSIVSGSAVTGGSYAKPVALASVPSPILRGPPVHTPLPLASTSAPNLTSRPAPLGSISQLKASPPGSKSVATNSESSYSHV